MPFTALWFRSCLHPSSLPCPPSTHFRKGATTDNWRRLPRACRVLGNTTLLAPTAWSAAWRRPLPCPARSSDPWSPRRCASRPAGRLFVGCGVVMQSKHGVSCSLLTACCGVSFCAASRLLRASNLRLMIMLAGDGASRWQQLTCPAQGATRRWILPPPCWYPSLLSPCSHAGLCPCASPCSPADTL